MGSGPLYASRSREVLTLCLVAIILFAPNFATSAAEDSILYYVQLIRGTDSNVPEDSKWQPIGERLSQKLQSVFRWKNYWEVSRQQVTVKKGKASRTRLTKEREIEIEFVAAETTEIRLIRNGVLTRKTRGSKETRLRILGGDKDGEESWFVVVRRDEPQAPK